MYLVKVFSIVLCCISISAHAQIRERLITGWEFVQTDLGNTWEAIRPAPAGSPEAVPEWQKISVPHCVNALDAVDPDRPYYQGPAWYRRWQEVSNPYLNGRTLLHFEGAGQKTTVFVGTERVAEHIGGYDEWTVDITDAVGRYQLQQLHQIKADPIPILVKTDNSRDASMIPSNLSDFTIYGGLYRYVNLVYVPPVSIDKLFIETALNNQLNVATATIKSRFYNPIKKSSATVLLRLKDANNKVLQEEKIDIDSINHEHFLASITVKKPALWSPENPNLYQLECEVISDGQSVIQTEQLGFRRTHFEKNGPFFLNGKRLLLKGTHRHEDHASVGAAMTESTIREEMLLIKQMGVNFIRLGHYQQSRIVLNLCDSLGILVWEEIPWCRGGLGGDEYKDMAKRMLTNMIEQHYNHPSVFIWGLGNENDWRGDFPSFDTTAIQQFMGELNELSHRLDPGRKTAIRRCEFCADIVDVYSPSIWAGWYRGVYTDYQAVSKVEASKHPHFLHVEWGGDSHAGRHAENPDKLLQQVSGGLGADERAGDASLYGGAARVSKDGDWSESYIVNLFDWYLKEQENMPWLTGSAQWVFKDFSTPIRPENPVPYVNQKGLVQRDFTKKESYYVFQSYWATQPMVHIYGHSWPVRWGATNEPKLIKVYSNAQRVELLVNGLSLGIKQRNSQNYPAAGLRWEAILQHGTNTVIAKAWQNKQLITDTLQFEYQTTQWSAPHTIQLTHRIIDEKTTIVELCVADSNGVPCLDAKQFVRFGITGDGKLIDNLGTATGSRYVQLQNGRAQISVDQSAGTSVVSASIEGLSTVFLNLSL